MYLARSNPNGVISDGQFNRRSLLKGDLGERVIPKGGKEPAYFNPNYIDPNRSNDSGSQSPRRDTAAGISTNYGIQPKVNMVHVDPNTGQHYKIESGTSLLAQGPGTGHYNNAGSVARIKTPIMVKPMLQNQA